MNIKLPEIAHTICRRVREAGGEAHVTGGWIRDHFRGVEPNDLDIEVFGMSYERLKQVIEDLEPKAVGKAFGILALNTELCGGVKVDLNVPRRDNRVGVEEEGWGDTDPGMSVGEACLRRDFTVNGMAYDPLTGILTDPRNGMQDCLDGILRATEPTLFVQDVNRVLRTAQFLARWEGSRVDACQEVRKVRNGPGCHKWWACSRKGTGTEPAKRTTGQMRLRLDEPARGRRSFRKGLDA